MAPFADGGRLAHITNARETDKLKGRVEGFSRHNKYWSLQDVQRYLETYHADEAPKHFVDRQLRPFVKQVMRYLFESGRYLKEMANNYVPGQSMVWALDFAVDADYNVHLLEGNGNPSLNWNSMCSTGAVNDNFMASYVDLVERVQTLDWPRDAPPRKLGGWELVYNEAQEACEAPYNPCAVFGGGRSQRQVADAFRYRSNYTITKPSGRGNAHTYKDASVCGGHGTRADGDNGCACNHGWTGEGCTQMDNRKGGFQNRILCRAMSRSEAKPTRRMKRLN